MTTSTRKAPSYRLHKASGQAIVQFKGRRYYLGKYGTPESRERYQRFLAEAWVHPDLPLASPGGVRPEITIVELVAAYWRYAEGYYHSGHLGIIRLALRPLRELYGQSPATAFGPLAFRAIQEHLINRGVSRSHANQVGSIIKRTFKWGVSQELIPPSIHQALATVPGLKRGRTAAREPEPIGPVSDQVVEATLPHLPIVVADMVRVQRFTGCRPGEVCSLRPCDVDRTSDLWVYRPAHHKTEHRGKARAIYIGPKAQEVLTPYLLRPADAFCFSPAESEAKRKVELRERRKTRVQPSQVNRAKRHPKRVPSDHYVKDSYRLAVHRAVDRANRRALEEALARGEEAPHPIPHWHPNQLRHAAATEIRRLFGLEAAQVALGHSRADVTQVYAERDSVLAKQVAMKIG